MAVLEVDESHGRDRGIAEPFFQYVTQGRSEVREGILIGSGLPDQIKAGGALFRVLLFEEYVRLPPGWIKRAPGRSAPQLPLSR